MRFRLQPTPTQERAPLEYCAHARFIWNLALEQRQFWRPGRSSPPGYAEQSRQLTEARKAFGWLAEGSRTVQEQALRDFAQAMSNFSAGTHRHPLVGPGTGEVVGVDRGVVVSAALSTGELLRVPTLCAPEAGRLRRLQRGLAHAQRGSNRRRRVKIAISRLKARELDRRKHWVETVSTDLARRFDLIRIEDLKIRNMVRSARGTTAAPGTNVRAKAGLNRGIYAAGWGRLMRRSQDKAPGRVQKVNPAFTSQTCHACGHSDPRNRESQAVFRCRACRYSDHADVNAAKNIAVGRTVTARGALQPLGGAENREPQPVHLYVEPVEIPCLQQGRTSKSYFRADRA